MRPLAFLLVNLWSAAAWAVDPTALPVGVWFDVVSCLESGEGCDAAGTGVADPAWSRFLTGADPGALAGDDRFVLNALRCADGAANGCEAMADGLDLSPTPADHLRAAMLRVRACELGAAGACSRVGASTSDGVYAWRVLSGGATWDKPYAATGFAPAPADAKAFAALARAADSKKAQISDHLALAGSAWRSLGDPAGRAAAASTAADYCADHPGSTACPLAEDLGAPAAPFDPRLAPSTTLLWTVCTDDQVGTACAIHAALDQLGRAQPWGTFRTRWTWRHACDNGDERGCQQLTAALRSPHATEATAVCDAALTGGGGDARACMDVSTMRRFGVGADKDEEMADRLTKDACRVGDGSACLHLAGETWDEDKLAAWSWYNLACDAGDAVGCSASGRMQLYGQDGVAEDPAAALRRLQRAVDKGLRNAMLHLGNAKFEGAGTARDLAGAMDLYLRACAMGDPWACGNLGTSVVWRHSSLVDVTSAIALMRLACEQGDESSCFYLGDAFSMDDDAVTNDLPRALWGYDLACEQEDEEGCARAAQLRAADEALEPAEATAAPLPTLRPRSTLPTYTPPPNPTDEPDRPRPSPSPIDRGRGGLSLTAGAGSARSWTAERQAASLRVGLLYSLGLVGVGLDVDWVSDNRWRPKVARDYWRVTGFLNVRVRIPIYRSFGVALGGGGGVGAFRAGPGTFNPAELSYGAQEFIQFGWGFRDVSFGVRIEQQQLFQASLGGSIDHVTGVHGVLGVSFD